MPDKETAYAEVIKFFALALKQNRLYTEKHPAAQMAVRGFFGALERALSSEGALTFGFMDGRIIVNDHPLAGKSTGVSELLRESHRLQINGLVFERGVGEEEINSFFKIIAMPPKSVEELGGFKKVFEGKNFQYVRLETTRYKMIKEEEEVVKKSESGKGEGEREGGGKKKEEVVTPGRGRRIERMEELVEHLIKGGEGKIELTLDVERLAYEVEKKPEIIAREVVHRAEDLEALKRIVQDLGRFLQEHLARPLIEEGKDFSPRISRFAKEFKKALEGPDVPDDFKASVQELVARLEHCADEVKLELITKAFQDSGGDTASLARIVGKFVRGKEARERLLEPLRERISALVGEKGLDQAFASLGETRARRKSGRIGVSPEELKELRRIRDRFEHELSSRVERETQSMKQELTRTRNDKERVDNVIRSLAEGLVVVDNQGRIQLLNPAAEKLLGVNQEKGKGVPLGDSLKVDHIVALAKGPLRDEADGLTREIEVKSMDAETRRVLQASSAVIENEEGRTVGMVSVLSDITKQKKLDEMKSKFVAHVSHELRTPLVAIEQSLELLLGKETGEVSPDQEKFLSIAQRNISRLSRLVNDLLDVAKLEAGQMKLNVIPFKVSEMVHHVVETVLGWAGSKQVTVEEHYPEEDVEINADADRLIQVVTNLVGNALKFTPEAGKIIVDVDTGRIETDISREPCVAISVKDTGIGIPLEDQQKIFEKFEQGSLPSPKGPVSSTGLGLTIAREIVELHGGKIWVESKPGEGSRFVFVIPRWGRDGAGRDQAQG